MIGEDPANGKLALINKAKSFYRQTQLETENKDKMMDEVEWTRKMKKRRGGSLKYWRGVFWQKIDEGVYTEEDPERGTMIPLETAKAYINREIVGAKQDVGKSAQSFGQALKQDKTFGARIFKEGLSKLVGGKGKRSREKPDEDEEDPDDDESEEDSDDRSSESDEEDDDDEDEKDKRKPRSSDRGRPRSSSAPVIPRSGSCARRGARSSSPQATNIGVARPREGKGNRKGAAVAHGNSGTNDCIHIETDY